MKQFIHLLKPDGLKIAIRINEIESIEQKDGKRNVSSIITTKSGCEYKIYNSYPEVEYKLKDQIRAAQNPPQ